MAGEDRKIMSPCLIILLSFVTKICQCRQSSLYFKIIKINIIAYLRLRIICMAIILKLYFFRSQNPRRFISKANLFTVQNSLFMYFCHPIYLVFSIQFECFNRLKRFRQSSHLKISFGDSKCDNLVNLSLNYLKV